MLLIATGTHFHPGVMTDIIGVAIVVVVIAVQVFGRRIVPKVVENVPATDDIAE